jgi:hypothetical protein
MAFIRKITFSRTTFKFCLRLLKSGTFIIDIVLLFFQVLLGILLVWMVHNELSICLSLYLLYSKQRGKIPFDLLLTQTKKTSSLMKQVLFIRPYY